ncbi:hypothetical protein DFH05DRAFT_1404766 [Lentinula detonsa]|uniref:Uncharacterized protein n=1 Tax=Lentinula detonsa TaxID=2804962 RepID=A0A9W8NU15_9AGAR|nr:hypothetical protein DFH05DRAFT_1404766 [Lentinula detonsa]
MSIDSLLNPLTVSNLLNPAPANCSSDVHPGYSLAPARQLIHRDYKLNSKTTLSVVYLYPPGSVVEYPETGQLDDQSVGHLFHLDPKGWAKPSLDFLYSRGEPRGYSRGNVSTPLLVSSITGQEVPCTSRYSTCQGVKVCPMSMYCMDSVHHFSVSRTTVITRLKEEQQQHQDTLSPASEVFERTTALLAALIRVGCTSRTATELEVNGDEDLGPALEHEADRQEMRRGFPDAANRCTGNIIFGFSSEDTPFIRGHFFDGSIGNGRYHVGYLQAVFEGDTEEIVRLETEAKLNGYGPLAACQTAVNRSSQRITCGALHRDQQTGCLKRMKFAEQSCTCKFHEYEPKPEYRHECPYILVVSKGPHTHLAPIPEKTPTSVKIELESLLQKLEVDLADITPRSFLRHPVVKSYLSSRFPMLQNPMLSNLHISLSNRSHLKVYIQRIKRTCFPWGTGWNGLKHLKMQQDELLAPDDQYIRLIIEIPSTSLGPPEEDDIPEDDGLLKQDEPLRIVICMTSYASNKLVKAQYLQSDIAFKRVVGFYEFEIASVDPYANTSLTFCRVYMTRQTAFAHKEVMKHINAVLEKDTGRGFRWRHIHGSEIDDYNGVILNWVVDQHGGQAKGIGLYLQDLSQALPPKLDFHQPLHLIQDLDAYGHLRRFLTVCTTHFYRNIRKCSVSEDVRNLMRSLSCIRHDDWESTVQAICHLGGTPAKNWIMDKERAKFAFPGLCWEKSYIPLEIWQARRRESNIAEIVHANC